MEAYIRGVTWHRHFGVLSLLLILCAAPVMACMRADAQMSADERACCRMMKGDCGGTQMPASHSCCQKTLQSTEQNALHSKTVVLGPAAMVTATLVMLEVWSPSSASADWVESPEHSPPKSPLRSISILRV